jgi:hypothetical protein
MLKPRERCSALAMLLVVVIALAIVPGVGWADDDDKKNKNNKNDNQESGQKPAPAKADARPDLKIEYMGYYSPGVNDQVIKFKVTNVGKAKSTAIKAKVVTLEPEPTPWQRDLDVRSLAPNESVEIDYPLAASCNGHRVLATINDPLDFPSANDRVEAEVCKAKSAPPPQGGPIIPSDQLSQSSNNKPGTAINAPIEEELLKPEHLRLGEHTMDVPASVSRYRWVNYLRKDDDSSWCFAPEDTPDTRIGFAFSAISGCESNIVYQYITDFNLQWLRTIQRKLVVRAELLYDERIAGAENGAGVDILAESIAGGGTCIGRVGLAPNDFEARIENKQLISTDASLGDRVAGGWDVTREIQYHMVPQTDWNGFVLHGWDENLGAVSNAVCVSSVTNVRLRLTYIIL